MAGLLVLAGMGDVYAEQYLSTLPSVKGLDAASFTGDTFIYDRNGVQLADLGDNGNHRQYLTLKQISPLMVKATIDIEDKNFYRNSGFDLTGIARAAVDNYRSRRVVGGGSTITQQLAKQILLTPEQSYNRKMKELVLAYQLSQTYTKDQVLELYLNKSYYGQQAYGVEAAAQTYFKKPAKDLDAAESALLAGIPQAPTEWNPITHPERAKLRQLEVLHAMTNQRHLTPEESAAAAARVLDIKPPRNEFKAPHFVNYVQDELRRLGFKPGIQQLFVTTTLDYGKQKMAEDIIRDNLANMRWRDPGGQLHSGMTSLDPHTAQIITFVGSDDYNSEAGQYDYIYERSRNTGSSMKVFTYAAALNSRRVTTESLIVDGPSPYFLPGGGTGFFNYDKSTHGTLPLREAWSNSLNIPALKVELVVGVPAVVEFERDIGLFPEAPVNGQNDPRAPLAAYGASLTLGGYPVKILDEAHALATIANMGVYHDLEGVLSVKDVRGKVLYQTNPEASRRQAIDPGVAFITAQVMSDNFNRRQIFGLNSTLHWSDRTVAAKTGTSDDFKDDVVLAFTPDLATVFWIGDTLDNTHFMIRGSSAEATIAPTLHQFVIQALKGVPGDKWYAQPGNVVRGDPATQPHAWFLADQRNVPKLSGEMTSPSPSPSPSAIPADPSLGPSPLAVPASPSPRPQPSSTPNLPPFPLPSPTPTPGDGNH